ncbi:uncharacterized protein C8R40DRAFT_1248471 [Lentinula edodes]|uniref:uncharacterized protein n=1 Tax=Lentinula edodes TaxID=5353 RepID=UPI001E8D3303|nr:uncharacterized protein C8R40DRAFT_1248471 [Lentinula edodes]KAH7877254.1 hypothetical protein C8R40DRAFT_1248471 [Lentinula edodes]
MDTLTSTEAALPSAYPRDFSFFYDYRTFLVEGYLFKFPINTLAIESDIFRTMMEVPAPSQTEGLTDENPIHLEGVLKDDFRQLLRVLAPPRRFKEPVPILTFSEWTSVLRLADMWCMDVVKEHAISNMNNLADIDPIDKIVVARKYEIKAWLKPAFNDVLQRSKTFTEDDVERLGVSTLLQLVALRDRLQLVKSYDETSYSLKPQRQAVSFDFTPAIELNLPDFKDSNLHSLESKKSLETYSKKPKKIKGSGVVPGGFRTTDHCDSIHELESHTSGSKTVLIIPFCTSSSWCRL